MKDHRLCRSRSYDDIYILIGAAGYKIGFGNYDSTITERKEDEYRLDVISEGLSLTCGEDWKHYKRGDLICQVGEGTRQSATKNL